MPDATDPLPCDDGSIHEPTANERDPRRPDGDPFHPPSIATLVHCIHCGEEYDSYRIEWRVEPDASGKPHGRWCCPVPGCDGAGFGFDIFPVDPDYADPDGREIASCFFDDDGEADEDDFLDEDDDPASHAWGFNSIDDLLHPGDPDWLAGPSDDQAWPTGDDEDDVPF